MSDDRKEKAAVRARAAHERAVELEERRARLSRGEHVTPDDRRRAQEAAGEAAREAAQAQDRARVAHEAAAKRHRSAAEYYERHNQPADAKTHRQAADDETEADQEHA